MLRGRGVERGGEGRTQPRGCRGYTHHHPKGAEVVNSGARQREHAHAHTHTHTTPYRHLPKPMPPVPTPTATPRPTTCPTRTSAGDNKET